MQIDHPPCNMIISREPKLVSYRTMKDRMDPVKVVVYANILKNLSFLVQDETKTTTDF